MNRSEKGKPVERQGRKATGLNGKELKALPNDSRAAHPEKTKKRLGGRTSKRFSFYLPKGGEIGGIYFKARNEQHSTHGHRSAFLFSHGTVRPTP